MKERGPAIREGSRVLTGRTVPMRQNVLNVRNVLNVPGVRSGPKFPLHRWFLTALNSL
jgi:hypothetical protein